MTDTAPVVPAVAPVAPVAPILAPVASVDAQSSKYAHNAADWRAVADIAAHIGVGAFGTFLAEAVTKIDFGQYTWLALLIAGTVGKIISTYLKGQPQA